MSGTAIFSATLTAAAPRSALLEGSRLIRALASRAPLVSTQTPTCLVRVFRVNADGEIDATAYTGSLRIDSEMGGITLPGVALESDAGAAAGLHEIIEFKFAASLDWIFVYLPTAADTTAGVRLRVEVVV